jgi:membrane protein CcdC involved in cytochrome C biogenesis
VKLEILLRDLSLRAIAFLVILIGLWAVVLMVGVSFNWSFLTNKVEGAFYLGGFLVGLLIFALSFTNVTANLTIISKAQNKESKDNKNIKKQFLIMLLSSAGLIIFLVSGLWLAEWQVYKKVKQEAIQKALIIAEKEQFRQLAKEIGDNGTIRSILELRDALSYDVDSKGKISFLIPRLKAGTKIYYEITPWLKISEKEKLINDVDLNLFQPNHREKKDFEKLSKGEIETFTAPAGSNYIRIFLTKTINGQEVVILLDTSRKIDDYRGSFK